MLTIVRKSAAGVAAVAVLGLGGAAMADAAKQTPSKRAAAAAQRRAPHDALASDVAAKVKAAALEKVPGATVDRVEGPGPYASAYHAHITAPDGTRQVVLVDDAFTATAVRADNGPVPGAGHRGRGPGEKALTGTTKDKVEAAVRARYPGATVERTESNGDGSAPYESHITTSGGKELEVLVSSGFEVVDARERPARP